MLLIVTELITACVDGQGVVSLSLAVEDVSVSYGVGHGVPVTILVASVD